MKKDYTSYSDEDLVRLIKSGVKDSGNAFAEIYKRYSPKVNAYCKSMIKPREQAEDIFQEVFIRFFRKIDPDYDCSNVFAYLMKVARNLCLNYMRDKRTTSSIEDFEFPDVSDNYENKEFFNIIMSTIDLLDEKYREPFILRELDGLSYQEVADICNLSLSNAKSRVSRAREKLVELLHPYLNDYAK